MEQSPVQLCSKFVHVPVEVHAREGTTSCDRLQPLPTITCVQLLIDFTGVLKDVCGIELSYSLAQVLAKIVCATSDESCR